MNDHEWLDRVRTALKEYARQHPTEELPATIFVRWLHQQYGIVYKDADHGQS